MMVIRRILCPIDFSEFSRHALARAASLALTHGAAVTALHVVKLPPPMATLPLEMGGPVPVRATPEAIEATRRELHEFVREESVATTVECDVIEARTIHDEIVAHATRLKADLIVMGTHGRAGFRRLLLGSVAERVLRRASQPVMLVGESRGNGRAAFQHILCGVDFSRCSIAALDYALALAGDGGASVTVATVVEMMPGGYDPLAGTPSALDRYRLTAESAAGTRLHETVERAHTGDLVIEELVRVGKPYHELLRLAADGGVDLIVLGFHGSTPADRVFFGSTTELVVRHACCPVLTVQEQSAAPEYTLNYNAHQSEE
jgi:nucleotide-binding universal stress UspA family protein